MNNEYDNSEDIGEFQGVEMNFETAYHESRKLMGTQGTDLDDLFYHVGLMYTAAPDKWAEPYMTLLREIEMRQEIMAGRL